jgi:hypothetical protein
MKQARIDADRHRSEFETVWVRDLRRFVPADIEPCTAVVCYEDHEELTAAYAEIDIEVGLIEAGDAVEAPEAPPVVVPDPEPEKASSEPPAAVTEEPKVDPTSYPPGEARVENRGNGWYDAVRPDGSVINEDAVRKKVADELLLDFADDADAASDEDAE